MGPNVTAQIKNTSRTTIKLTIGWDNATFPKEQQKQILEGISATLAAAMTGDERKEFLLQLQQETARSQQREEARKARKKP